MKLPARLRRPVSHTPDELDFLPAHLELIERPVSPTLRALAATLATLFCLGLLWGYVGHVDIVASAQGRTVATTGTKTIQAMETALVRRVHVSDGEVVASGQPLIDLVDTSAIAERTKAAEALAASERAATRKRLLLEAFDHGFMAKGESGDTAAAELARLDLAQYLARKEALEATLAQRREEAATAKAQIAPLAESADISRRRADDTRKLVGPGHVARHELLQREQERVESQRAVQGQRDRLQELFAAVAVAQRELQAHVTATRQEAADQLRQATESMTQYRQDVASAEQRIAQLHLTSPVDGTVQQLAVHTVGGVVTTGQPLLLIVPQDDPLEIEATVLNQDIGFVRAGQPVTVKIETFPYTRYGFIRGRVQSVSHDAVQDEKLGLVFPARIRMDAARIVIDGVEVSLSPGMSVTAEVKTGKRRLIDYLLSPLKEHIDESARER